MRIEANLTAELDGKPVRIKWKNKSLQSRLQEVISTFVEESKKLQRKQDAGKISEKKADEKADKLLAQYHHDRAEIIFDWPDGCPDVEWFGRDEFPEGQLDFLFQVFTDPQIQT